MQRDRGGGSSKSEMIGGGVGGGGPLDRKRINEALDKQLEKSSPASTSAKKDRLSIPSTSSKSKHFDHHHHHHRSAAPDNSNNNLANKAKCSDEESETDSEESDVSGSDEDDTSWISWFCNLRGNEFFCEVDDEYIQDDFNLCGLSSQVPYYDYALDLILDVESSHGDMFTEEQNELVESAAEMLYGLIHVRYILTTKGMSAMLEKFKNYDFGRCPRVYCCGQPCLPVGQSDIPRSSTVKIYCPKCEDIYYPRSKYQGNVDGAYFGTRFPHLFLMTYGNIKPSKATQSYVPRLFGNPQFGPGRAAQLDLGYGSNVVGFRPARGGNFGVLRNPRVQSPIQYRGGILAGQLQSMGSMQRSNSDADRWQRATSKGLIPSPQTPSLAIHKAERKCEVGKVTDEEQAKQRQLKGILNKLTPQNFEKLFQQVKEVNIDSAISLTGVTFQIFDKALMEPTFCEIYADLCFHLAGELPDFNEDGEKITFKRVLLNMCQEQFERGEREEEEANRVEEGEVKQSEEEREEKSIKARSRMLGNIRLIGELYKKKMLTEKIMHECIKKLLGQYQNPNEDDIEALCKLMSTIGEMIDHPRAKGHMDAYFEMMAKLSTNMKLSSRVRFVLQDVIDLRVRKWRRQRRKIKRPKKIEEVHRDAAHERHAQTSRLARGLGMNPSVRRGAPMDFGPEKVLSEERLRDMSIAAIEEFYSAKDEKEVALCIRDLKTPTFYPSMIALWVTDSFERKDMERDILARLLVSLTSFHEGLLSQTDLLRGFESALSSLEDAVNDAPKAPEFLGKIFAKVVVENVIPLGEIGQIIYRGGEEPGSLRETGLAGDVLGSVLEMIQSEKGDSVLNEIRSSSNLRLEDFKPPGQMRSRKLEKFI